MLRDGSVVSQQLKRCLCCAIVPSPLLFIDTTCTLTRYVLMGAVAEESNCIKKILHQKNHFAVSTSIVTDAL